MGVPKSTIHQPRRYLLKVAKKFKILDLLADLNFKHQYYDWQENEPTVVQFGELIERVADNFNQIAEMIQEACAELDKEKLEDEDEIDNFDQEQFTTIKRRKFKIQLMMDGMRYMATLNQV